MSDIVPPAADRPTVVLLHSSASSPRQWTELVEMLRRDFRVLAVEFHGHGLRPDWPHKREMVLDDDAALAVPLLEMVGGAHVIGHSYGAAVALKLVRAFPKLVHSVVAYEPVLFRLLADDAARPELLPQVKRVAGAMRDRVRAGQNAHAARVFVDFWSGQGTWAALPAKQQQTIELRMPSVIRHFDALFGEQLARDELAHMAMPMLFLSGSRTTAVARRISQLLRVALPLAEHEEIPGLGHMGPVTHPQVVNERIRRFLKPHSRFARTSVLPGRVISPQLTPQPLKEKS